MESMLIIKYHYVRIKQNIIFSYLHEKLSVHCYSYYFFFVVTQINNRNSGLQTEQKCIDWSNE